MTTALLLVDIDSKTRAAADLGFACSLAHDACATRDLSFGGALNGLFAKVRATDELRSDA